MKRIIQLTALLAAVLVLSAPAWSFSYTDHVSQAPNGKGDVLIFPGYLVLDGTFETKIQVINTSDQVSAVAKVVIRTAKYSQEVRDFFIFLSPTDMWEGTLKMNAAGEVVIYSEDDSTLTSSTPTFATPASPFEYSLVQPRCGDTNIYGYAEVFLAYVFDENAPGPVNLTSAIVDKEDIYNEYVGNGTLNNPLPTAGDNPAYVDPWNRNILAGNLQIQVPAYGWSAALNATVLKDYGMRAFATPAVETTFDTPVADNNFIEVEAALSKNYIGMPYYHDNDNGNYTLHFFNFPTKLVELAADCTVTVRGEYTGFDKVDVGILGLDMEENSKETLTPIVSPYDPDETTFEDELSWYFPTSYEQGWYRYILDNGPTTDINVAGDNLTYTGAPVIPFALNYGADGFSLMYGFYTDQYGSVHAGATTADRVLEGYNYVYSHAFSPAID